MLFNTMGRRKEPFMPLEAGRVGMYTCGPTVYNYAHIGNLRTYIFEDLLRRTLEYNGFAVRHVMNITDVGHLTSDADTGEDKMEEGARREGRSIWEIAAFYTEAFRRDIARLNILPPAVWCRATDHIAEQIELVRRLEEKGYAYRLPDGVYFDTSRFPDYGRLAMLDVEGLMAGARVRPVEGKRSPADFALWKLTPPGVKRQMEWDSPWGRGFPGWHIECSAMAMKYLGETFDIHAGGVDHINVHHTNEIAQAECATGKKFVRYWLHGEFLVMEKDKMSKSAGNFVTLQTLIDRGFDPLDYRYLCLTAHYRSQLVFRWESLEAARSARRSLLERIHGPGAAGVEAPEAAAAAAGSAAGGRAGADAGREAVRGDGEVPVRGDRAERYAARFLEAVNDDLNIPAALAVAWELARDSGIPAGGKKRLLLDFDRVFGLRLDIPPQEEPGAEIPAGVKELADRREEARRSRNWKEADALRAEIAKLGYRVEDTPSGPRISRV
ncbi:MAG: cysteine--tRNA ligase [Planctomycetota bacterium]|nr:cysteine--tRNA ligase [Planctomycetota bacterium]